MSFKCNIKNCKNNNEMAQKLNKIIFKTCKYCSQVKYCS